MITISGENLTIADVEAVADGAPVQVDPAAWPGVEASRAIVEGLVERGEVAYGITTGFGEFAHVSINRDQVEELQRNLIMSHSVGVGELLPKRVVRAMMLIRANTLLKGVSGIRRVVIERLVTFLNDDVVPDVPSRGSVGASGDLAPLAHMALPLIGLGTANGVPAEELPYEPLALQAKEGLALINGTQLMSAIGSLCVQQALGLLEDSQIVAAMSLEALMGSLAPFDPRVHALRPHPGQTAVAAAIRAHTEGSEIMQSHVGCDRVQDAYSLRCIPQVLGAVHDVLQQARSTLEVEINSATDNPLVFPNGDIISQGNFHGEPIAFLLDQVAIALSELANISERRAERMVNPDLSEGLKPFLVDKGGLNSGFMIAQYVAAALVSENKVYAHPASVDSIPTSAGQEDHVSMGSIGALKLGQVLENCRNVVAIEALCAAQALDFKAPLRPGKGTAAAHAAIRTCVSKLDEDRILSNDVKSMHDFLEAGRLRAALAPV
ncbi:MAG: histidine ammonia-lyase [Thermoplasmatota archaeon]